MAKMALILKSGGVGSAKNIYYLEKTSYTVGRDAECDIFLNDIFISRNHAALDLIKGKWYVQDLNSKNGTFLNGERIASSPVLVSKGDILGFGGKVEFVFEHEIANMLSTQVSAAPVSPYGIEINEDTQDVRIDKIRITPKLSPKEFAMISYMMKDAGKIHKYSELYKVVFPERPQKGSDFYDPADVQKSLYTVADSFRKKLKRQNVLRQVLKARNNVGYQLVKNEESS